MKKLFAACALIIAASALFISGVIVAQTRATPYAQVVRVERMLLGRDLTPIAGYELKQALHDTREYDRIVFIGDSHVELGNWQQLFDRSDIANRGISGDTTLGLLGRTSDSLPQDSQVFIIIGTNDVDANSPTATISNIEEVVKRFSANNRVVLVSTPLTVDPGRNTFNAALVEGEAAICQRLGCTFVDINSAVAPNGQLQPDMTVDGLHFNDRGYKAVASVLAPLLQP